MPSFLRDFLLEDPKRLAAGAARGIYLAAFGKHPGWNDHVEPIGLDTPSLQMAAQRLYDQGIGGRGGPIASGAWDRLPAEEVLPAFGHLFVWWRAGQFLLGRLWESSDSAHPPRTRYPLIVCLHVAGLPLPWALRDVLPRLEQVPVFGRIQGPAEIEAAVRQVWSSEPYRDELKRALLSGLDRLRDQLRAAAAEAVATPPAALLTTEERQRFVASPELGPDQEGLLRVLHQVDSRFAAYLSPNKVVRADANLLQPAQVRLPVAAPSVAEGILAWVEFFRPILAADAPFLLAAPVNGGWIDLTVGDPQGDQFFCLRATPKALPLTSAIPFTLDPAWRPRASQTIGAFVANTPAGTPPEPGIQPRESSTAFLARSTQPADEVPKTGPPKDASGASSARPKRRFWLFGGGAVGLLAAGLLAYALGLFPPGGGKSGEFDRTLAAARDAMAKGDFEQAATQSQAALALKPQDAVALKLRADAQQQAAAAKSAEDSYATAMREGLAVLERGEAGKALAQAEAMLTIKPGDAGATKLRNDAQAQVKAATEAGQKYATAMQAGQAAFGHGDLSNALAQAEIALGLKPGDAPAAKLKMDAQRQIGAATAAGERYAVAMKEGAVALSLGDATNALAQAEAALRVRPGDAAATKLRGDAQARIAVAMAAEKFTAALGAGLAVLQRGDPTNALAQANVALQLKPEDAEAMRLKFEAQKQIAAAQQYATSMKEGRAALAAGQTNALAHAGAALAIRPGDPAATQLKADAQRFVAAKMAVEERYLTALKDGRTALGLGDATNALARAHAALGLKPGDAAATKLQSDAEALMVAIKIKPGDPAATQLRTESQAQPAAPLTSDAGPTRPVLKSSIGMELVWVPGLPGTADGGYVGRYEVTQEEYESVMGRNPSGFGPAAQVKAGATSSRRLPVENVSYRDAVKFCEKLTDRDLAAGSLAKGWVYRLPATNQWDFFLADASRGDAVTSLNLAEPRKLPLEVGRMSPNKFGLCDVIGNVWEICGEYDFKGGAFNYPRALSEAERTLPSPYVGFRCIAVPKP